MYPNPFTVKTTLYIKGVGTQNFVSVHIYDLLGQEIKTINGNTNIPLTINREQIASGMYFYKVITKDKEVLGAGKMVVE